MNKKTIALLISALFASSAFSQSTLFRYTDAKGRVIYTDSVPPSEKGRIDVLSSKTMALKKVNEKELTSEEVEAKKAVEAEQKTVQLESDLVKQKNRSLLTTYTSVNDIDKMKDYELQQINRAISSDTEAVSSLKDRKTQLEQEIKDFKDKIPPKTDQEYKAVQQNIKSAQDNMDKNKSLYASREKKYSEDKTQYLAILEKMGQAPKK